MHVQVVLLDGFDPLDVIAPYEVLYAGGVASAGAVSVALVSAEGPREVPSGAGSLTLRATGALDPERAPVATVCGGSVILAMAGQLAGRQATTHHQGLDALDASGAHAVRARVVDDGDLVTGAGVTSGLDLGLYLLERARGPRIAHAVEELFAHERTGVVWRAQGLAPVGF
ncbi:DJ-1/PfpI family protein [Streptomyces sp. BRA346]|uniref:DJ-1/PfpI family protein n=1 Tax=Streptomyces sp. BRA346 TaxID=2878199 RepID=UPI0040644A77